MRSIGVLDFVRKKKRVKGTAYVLDSALDFTGRIVLSCFLAVTIVFCFLSSGVAASGGNVVMQTPSSSGAVIGKDPETGTRVMQTPEPKERETHQGPQTVIVAPEVYPDGHGGNRPANPRPPKPQPR